MLSRLLRAIGVDRSRPTVPPDVVPREPGQPGYQPALDRPAAVSTPLSINPRTPDQCYFCARPTATTCPGCGRPVCPADLKLACPLCSAGTRGPWIQDYTTGDWAGRRLRPYLRPVDSPPRTVLDVFAPQIQADVLAMLDVARSVPVRARLDVLAACQGSGNPTIQFAVERLIDPAQPLPVMETAAMLLEAEEPGRLQAILSRLAAELPARLEAATDQATAIEAYRIAAVLGSLGVVEPPTLPASDPNGHVAQARALLDGGTALDLFRMEDVKRAED